MNRFAYKQLLQWKKSKQSNYLLVDGVPGVGKTELVTDFISREYKNSKILSFVNIECIKASLTDVSKYDVILIDDLKGEKKDIVELYYLFSELKIPDLSVIFIDPYAKELRGDNRKISIPYITIFPFCFEEFLFNINRDLFLNLVNIGDLENISSELNTELINIFCDFLYVGGMPGVINLYKNYGLDQNKIRGQQLEINSKLYQFLSLFYSKTEYKNLLKVIKLIYPTLLRENKRFKITDISSSTRYKGFKKYFTILKKLNIIYESRVIDGKDKLNSNKSGIIYLYDSGLLGAINEVSYENYTIDNLMNRNASNAILLNSVANELYTTELGKPKFIYTWRHNMAKIEFVINDNNRSIALEIKNDVSGKLKSIGSFRNYFSNSKYYRMNINRPQKSTNSYPVYLIRSLYRKEILWDI